MKAGKKAADQLFDLLPPLDVGDPKDFIAAASAIFAEYPEIVMMKAVYAIAQRSDRPTLRLIRSVCEECFAPLLREADRRAAHASHVAGLLPRPKRTPEQQARIDAQVEAWRKQPFAPEASMACKNPSEA